MDTTIDSKAERVEAPERIWVPKATLDMGGGSIYIGQAWDDNDTEYIRVDRAPNTRQRAEQAARKLAHELNGGDRPDCSYPPELAALIDSPSIDNEAALAKWATDIIAAEFDK